MYRNKAGKFLMMKNEYTTFSVWDDTKRRVSAGAGDDKDTRGLISGSGPTCVTDQCGAIQTLPRDSGLAISCTDRGVASGQDYHCQVSGIDQDN